MPQEISPSELFKKAKFYAVELLARREHSRRELQTKLSKKYPDFIETDKLLQQLQQMGYQSDERFIESFISSRIQRGQGPLRITQELRHRGISSEMIENWLDAKDKQWLDLARETRLRKFGDASPETPKDKNKQVRFLQYRGFTSDQTFRALSEI